MVGSRTAVYRAMCDAEADATLLSGRPVFLHAHKFFSPHLAWVLNRVQDGRFGGRQRHAYRRILCFEFPSVDVCLFNRMNLNEWSLSRRDAQFLLALICETRVPCQQAEPSARAVMADHRRHGR